VIGRHCKQFGGSCSGRGIQARALDDMSTVAVMGIDYTSLHRGQSYITVVHDLDAKRLLFATEGRDHQAVIDFAANKSALQNSRNPHEHWR
jgi:transposase